MSMEQRILLIDDEPVITQTLSNYLRHAGYTDVRCVNDPLAAEHVMAEFNPHVLLLDVSMPDLDGLKILERLSDEVISDSLTVIIVTASEEDDIKRRALILGARDFICKPVDPDVLVHRVADAVAGKPNLDFILRSLPPRSAINTTDPTPPTAY